MNFYRLSLLLVVQLMTLVIQADAQPIVAAHQRFANEPAYLSEHAGRLLVEELNCLACHVSEDVAQSKQAPDLTHVMGRAKANHLREFILDPHRVKPGTLMPKLLENVADRDVKVDAILHYLGSLGNSEPPQSYATFGGRRRGEQLFHSVGCVACHDPVGKKWATSIPLGNLPAKYTLPSLAKFLANPLHVRQSGRMPDLNLTSSEARDIASFLLPDVPEKAGIEWSYYELNGLERLPLFEELEPKATGTTTTFDLAAIAKRSDNFAIRFRGELVVEEPGKYRFYVGSDDGTRLRINDDVVIENDGVHGMKRAKGSLDLVAGSHAVVLDYFEREGGEELEVAFRPPGGDRMPLDQVLVSAAPQESLEDLSFSIDPAKAAEGKMLFASIGCAACHDLKNAAASKQEGPALADLGPARGCLAPSNRPADYQLDDLQRQAIAQFITSTKKPFSDQQVIKHTALKFNCLACHQRGEWGGVEEQRTEFFRTTQKEMGVEGSIPPHLNGVGAKITRSWLEKILAEGAKDRPYMLTKMPKFGTANVGHLGALLEAADALAPLADVPMQTAAKKVGHRLVGDKGFSCIKCHTFGRHKATGVQSIDMTIMTKRLREDWFRQYVRNPQAYRRGTRMPSAWPVEGKSYLPDVLDGDCDRQIQAVWNYLKDGTKAITPSGLATGGKELIPIEEAIIYRNFIQGAGARAIGVGYPEGRHLAFDANELTLALIWKGAFIDAKRHWTGRGQGYEPPAGESRISLVQGVPFATLKNGMSPWPSEKARDLPGYQFSGYRLSQQQHPTFLYEAAGCRIEDLIAPKDDGDEVHLLRRMTITGSARAKTYFRVAAGEIVALENSGIPVYDLGNGLTVAISRSARQPEIRPVGSGSELLIPLSLDAAQEIEIEYRW